MNMQKFINKAKENVGYSLIDSMIALLIISGSTSYVFQFYLAASTTTKSEKSIVNFFDGRTSKFLDNLDR